MAVYGSNISTQVDFLEGVEMSDCISDHTPLNEMMYVVIEQTEEDFNKIMMECGVRELAYVEENHTEMVYEASGIKKLTDSVKKWFEDVWAKIKKMINTALDNIAKKSAEFRSKILKNLNKDFLKKRLENVEKTRNFGTTYTYADISGKNEKIITALDEAEKLLIEHEDDINKKVKDGSSDLGDSDKECKKIIFDAVQRAANGFTTEFDSMKGTDFSASNAKKWLLRDLRGDNLTVNGEWVKSHFDEIIKEVGEFPKTKRELKSSYNKTKASINKSIKNIKSHDNSKFFEASVFTKIIKYVKQLKQLLVVCQQSVITCVNEREAFYRSVIIKVVGTKPVKESSVWDDDYFSESSTSDTISAMFEW